MTEHTDELTRSRTVSRAQFLRFGGVAAAGLTLPAVWSGGDTATAQPAGPSLVVDLRDTLGRPTYAATGFLHGLSQDGTQPSDALLRPLKPQLFRGGGSTLPGGGWGGGGYQAYAVRWRNVVDRFRRASSGPLCAEYCIVLSDLWGAEGVSLKPGDPYPGDGGDWSNYEQFLIQVVNDVKAAGMRPNQIQYEIWNEPDFSEVYFPRPQAQYEELWRRGVRTIRRLDPHARITGPTFTRLTTTGPSWHMDDWLDMVTRSGTAPDILSWHDLIPGKDPVTQADLARDLLAERHLDHVQLEINEYPPNTGLDPGFNAWYVARFQRSRIDYGVLAIYGACCMFPQLDGLLTQEGDQFFTTGRWWLYERYASVTGALVSVRPDAVVDAVAGTDPRQHRARIVIGNNVGDGSSLGTLSVTVEGIPTARRYLGRRGRIPVRVERIADKAKLDHPEVVRDLDIKPDSTRLHIDIPWSDSNSAYVITLGNQESQLPPFVIVGASPDDVVLLPDEPTTVTFLVRNYTDRALTVAPRITAPAGYTVHYATSVRVPANGDASLAVRITRTTATQADGALRLEIGDQSTTVALHASDNWARIATLTASSTHAPSSPANLNDGNTDSSRWGGGGAGGWNDDTASAFPDTVTATWAHPVPLSQIRVYTLDSAAFPAAEWGVRDYDLVVTTGAQSHTVAQVRGNRVGMVESRFGAASVDAVQVRILDSNSHDYSRLIEIEAYS